MKSFLPDYRHMVDAAYNREAERLPLYEHGGIAIGTGNQISDYTEPANWIAMTDAVREWRGGE